MRADQGPKSDDDPSFAPMQVEVPRDFERFVDEHYKPAYRFALSLTGDHAEACDITQQSFYLAYTRSHQLRDSSKRKQWLFSILHREFLHTRRRSNAHPQVNLEVCEPLLPPTSVDYAAGLDAKTVLLALQDLNETFRMPLALFYVDQLSYKEIAKSLSLPIGTVMSRLARGKQMLRSQLAGGEKQGARSATVEAREARRSTDG